MKLDTLSTKANLPPTNADDVLSTQWLSVIMLWLAGVYAAMQFAKFSTSFDSLLAHYQSSPSTISIGLSSVGIMGLIFGTVAGVLSGKLGHKKVLLASLLLGSSLSFLQSFLPDIEYLLFSRILEGLSHLGVVVSAPTLMISISEKRHQAICMGLWGTFFGVAFALMGWFGNQLLHIGGLSLLYQSHAILILPIFIYLSLYLKPSQRDNVKEHTQAKQEASLNQLEVIQAFIKDLVSLYKNPTSLLPGLVFLFHTSMFVSLLTFIPRLSEDLDTKNQLFIVLPLVSIAGTFLAGVLAQYWFTAQRVGTLAYAGVAFFSLLTFINIDSPTHFYAFAICLLIFSGLVAGSAFAMIPALVKEASEQAKSNGAIAQLGNLGASIGPPVFAATLVRFDSLGMMLAILALCFAGGCMTLYASRFNNE